MYLIIYINVVSAVQDGEVLCLKPGLDGAWLVQ
jgi:hypothetical protein